MSDNTTPSRSGKFLDVETWDAMKAAGFTEDELQADQPFGPVIFAYTRAQAIEDGVLVDLTAMARRESFTVPVAATSGVCDALVDLIRRRKPEDFKKYTRERVRAAALRAMLSVLHDQIARQTASSDRLHFKIDDVELWSHIGPGDEGEPVLTVMLEGED
jgi:hypothetical protein